MIPRKSADYIAFCHTKGILSRNKLPLHYKKILLIKDPFLPFDALHENLLAWYERHGRHELPWRKTDDVYRVYLSEVMLQQTQVKRVLEEYYFQFLERFPTLAAMACSPLEEVYGMWSGLGYYRRAQNLHASAKLCKEGLPQDIDALRKLPGVGRYTAHAIMSFGFKECVSVVDTNIARVLRRYFALENPNDKELWERADLLLNRQNPTHHNLALMDLGATVCLASNPTCHACPLEATCQGKHDAHRYTKKEKKNYEAKNLYFGVCIKENKIAMQKANGGMYKDLLTLPSLDEPQENGYFGSFNHAVTRFRLSVHLYTLHAIDAEGIIWVDRASLPNAPISSMTKKALACYEKHAKEAL